MVNGNGQALLIPRITGAPASDRLNHDRCKISIPYTQNTRLYRMTALGMRYDPDDRTLYQVEIGAGDAGIVETPIAFDLTASGFRYEYESSSGVQVFDEPRRDAGGRPLLTYDEGGETYELARIQLRIGTEAGENRGSRSYVGYVEMRGFASDDLTTAPDLCGDALPGPAGGTGPGAGSGSGVGSGGVRAEAPGKVGP